MKNKNLLLTILVLLINLPCLLAQNSTEYNNQGLAKYKAKDFSQALLDFNKAIELDVKNEKAWHNRGLTKYALKDYKGSIEDQTKAIELTVQPNPFSTETMLLSSSTLINATITLYNSLGNSVKSITNVYGNAVVISRDKLPGGFYFIQLKQVNEMSLIKKLIISDN